LESTVDVITGSRASRIRARGATLGPDPMAAELGAWEAAQRSRGVEVEFVD
jgi:hypothetical protein